MPLGVSPARRVVHRHSERACIRNTTVSTGLYPTLRVRAPVAPIGCTRTRVCRYRDQHANHASLAHNSTLMEFGSGRSFFQRPIAWREPRDYLKKKREVTRRTCSLVRAGPWGKPFLPLAVVIFVTHVRYTRNDFKRRNLAPPPQDGRVAARLIAKFPRRTSASFQTR